MRRKRIAALIMTFCLFASSSLVSADGTASYAQPESASAAEQTTAEEPSGPITDRTEAGLDPEKYTGSDNASETHQGEEKENPDNIADPEKLTPVTSESDGVGTTSDMKPQNESAGAGNKTAGDEQGKDRASLDNKGKASVEKIDRESLDVDLKQEGSSNQVGEALKDQNVSEDELVRVIIVMDGNSVIEGNSKAELNAMTKLKSVFLEAGQNAVVSKIEDDVLDGGDVDVRYHYTWLLNGVAAQVPYGKIDAIESIEGVDKVLLQPSYQLMDKGADTYTISDGSMIGREDTWASGYTGKGIKIAIIDTGIDEDHQNFAAMAADRLTADSATQETIGSVLGQLNAASRYPGLSVDSVYYSNKIAYGFNYSDTNLIINHSTDSQGDHGTHVAGIAGANDLNNGEAVGVAPDAQLYVMKVFGRIGSAYAEDVLASIEDALILDADVINMSLGSPCGFTSDGEFFDDIYGRVNETNTILAIAAGNSATLGQGNAWGTNSNLASNPDNSTVSSPSTYVNATSVASVDNVGIMGYYFETAGRKMSYIEGQNGSNQPMMNLAGQQLDYALVDNFGQTIDDFLAADVAGKIAVVQRGVTAFTEKCQLAEEAGAIACLIYNNTAGTINMDMSSSSSMIPCASITKMAGEYLVSAKEENPSAVILFSTDQAVVPSETAYQMSDFSSWGVSPDLSLEPDITAPGGNIYSTRDNGTYGLMSGTSMASPNVAGMAALVTQYAKEKYPEMSDAEMHNFVNTLLMSTSSPLEYGDGVMFSPRRQGSGLANAYNAVNTGAYLSVDGVDMPKAQLMDDPQKSGTYSYTFKVTSITSHAAYYDLSTLLQTEGVMHDEALGKNFMSMTPVALDGSSSETSESMVYTYDYNENGRVNTSDARKLYLMVPGGEADSADDFFRYNLDGDENADNDDVQAYLDALTGKTTGVDLSAQVLKVNPGETASVTVNVQVSDAGRAYMDANFENGIYVEGFTQLEAMNRNGVDLSLPYMGFYGDWTKAPILDSGFYWESEDETEYSQYTNTLLTQFGEDENSVWAPGINPYFNIEFDPDKISLSPNGDSYADSIEDIYVSLLRNVAAMKVSYVGDDGTVYFEETIQNVAKSFYRDDAGMIIPFVYSLYGRGYDLTDAEGNVLPNNTKLTLNIEMNLDYREHAQNNLSDKWQIPITIDTEAPVIKDAVVYAEEGTGKQYLELTFSDNVAVAGMNFLNKSGTMILAQYPVEDTPAGEDCTMLFDITGFGNEFTVIPGDYALNENAYVIRTENNDPVLDENALYGYRVHDDQYGDDSVYGWLAINPENAEAKVLDSEYYMDYALTAAEYVGGYIMAVDANKELLCIKPGYWDERNSIASLGFSVRELAFDPVTEKLYAYSGSDYALYSIDIYTGETVRLTSEMGFMDTAVAMAFGKDGKLYGIDTMGNLKLINAASGEWSDQLLELPAVVGGYPSYAQSMVYDDEQDCLLWASYVGESGTLYKIDVLNNYAVTGVGTIAGNAEVVGLLKLDGRGFSLPAEAPAEKISLQQKSVSLLPGGSQQLNVVKTPWYAVTGDLVWSSADLNVAEVDEYGNVTANGVGETEVTVKTADGKLQAVCRIKVVNPQADLTGFVMTGNTMFNQWVSFNAGNTEQAKALTENGILAYYAGEYLDGYVYAYSAATELYRINAETMEAERISAPRTDFVMADMAYNYADGYLYGIAQETATGQPKLVAIDVLTGKMQTVGTLVDDNGYPATALAISTEGTIYILSESGVLNKWNARLEKMESIGATGYSASSYTQSMAYDHNGGGIYWSMISNGGQVGLMYIDPDSGKALALGAVDSGAQISSLYVVPENVPEREKVPVESMTVSEDPLVMLEGAKKCVPVDILPFNATDRNAVWTVENPDVATIENGIILAKKPGTTKVSGSLSGQQDVQFTVQVMKSGGNIRGFVLADLGSGAQDFWGQFKDNDLSKGEGLADGSAYALTAGEYYNGKVYGYGTDNSTYAGQFMVFDAQTFKIEKTVVGDYPEMRDMAFDYSTGSMYALGGVKNTEGNTSLYAVDLNDGQVYLIAKLAARMVAMTCSADGKLYGIDSEGMLYQIGKNDGSLIQIGSTGYSANQYQSMGYDHNTGNIYWSQAYNDPMTWATTASLLIVNPKDASTVNLGQIGTNGCLVSALHTLPEKEIPVQTPEVTNVLLDSASIMLYPGETGELKAKAFPLSVMTESAEFTFTSLNPEIASVDKNGVVTAKDEGEAEIKVECGKASAVCKVFVAGDSEVIYALNSTGWEKSPLLKPGKISESKKTPADSGLEIAKATYCDGYFYAVDTSGYLWRFTEDMSAVEKISSKRIGEMLDNGDVFDSSYGVPSVVDLTADPVSGKVYAMVVGASEMDFMIYEEYYIYELDLTSGAAAAALHVPMNIVSPREFVFAGETGLLIYDGYIDKIYKADLSMEDGDSAGEVAWVQSDLAAGSKMGMVYSQKMDLAFIATIDEYHGHPMALYVLDPSTGKFRKLAAAAYNKNMVDLVLLEDQVNALFSDILGTNRPEPSETAVPEETSAVNTEAETDSAESTRESLPDAETKTAEESAEYETEATE